MNNAAINTLKRNLDAAKNFFTPKNWSIETAEIWRKAFNGQKSEHIENGFNEYYRTGKHMPKPAEILAIIEKLHPRQKKSRPLEQKPDQLGDCNLIIASAWLHFNELQNGEKFLGPENPLELTHEQAILICNYEAKRHGMTSAIKKEFWISEIWGGSKPEQTPVQQLEELKRPRAHKNMFGPIPDYSDLLRQTAA